MTFRYGPEEAVEAIWVFLEEDSGQLANVSLELLSKCRSLADEADWPLVGVLIAGDIRPRIHIEVEYLVDELILLKHELLEQFTVEGHSQAAYQAIRAYIPAITIFGATANGRDLAGRLAVRLRTGLNADCTEIGIDPDSGGLICQVSGFGGGILALIETPSHRPQMATVRPGVYQPTEKRRKKQCLVTELPVDVAADLIRTTIVEQSLGQEADLTKAPVIVAGGRGIEGHFDELGELARLLGGEVGATRPPVDEGYIGRERQIGQTGVICRPDVTLACGISGAFHFLVGIEESGTVIAINTDPEAPIFEHADYYAEADAVEVTEILIDIIRTRISETEEPIVPIADPSLYQSESK